MKNRSGENEKGIDLFPGNVAEALDSNHGATLFWYDGSNRRITTVLGGAASTRTYQYGKLVSSTDFSGLFRNYVPETVLGRLDHVADRLGNSLAYSYDGQGNITGATVDAADGGRLWHQGYSYQEPNVPGRLWKVINPDGSETVCGYDAVGNVSSFTDARGKATGYQYDRRNRLLRINQPGGLSTHFHYDPHGNPIHVEDAKGRQTVYAYDDFGRVLSVSSPDSGSTVFGYDDNANRVSRTDANGVVTTYSFDALGRLTGVGFPDAGQNLGYTYDQGANGKGRLTGMTFPAGAATFTYNERGQLFDEITTIAGADNSFGISHGYDVSTTNLESLAYPSGLRLVTLPRDPDGRVSSIRTSEWPAPDQAIVQDVTYLPFGGVEDYTFGNGRKHDRTFDQRYLIARIQSGAMDYQYSRDAVGNVTTIAGKNLPPAPPSDPGAALDYPYGSNRLDRLTAATTRQYQYDNNGNTISDGMRTFVYNQDNRLVRVLQDQAVLADYAYDGFGRRVKKTTAQGVTVYHYDLHDRLLAESKGDGTPLRDYIYLEEELVAFREYGTQAGYYYVMNDHLATPQFVTDQNGATVWEAAYGPYGEAVVEVATVEFNLRFPGQYYDAETGLHYNWHRYYDPSTGRYLTPDPIGLEGGINLYSYANQNPVNYIDPFGLKGWAIDAGGAYGTGWGDGKNSSSGIAGTGVYIGTYGDSSRVEIGGFTYTGSGDTAGAHAGLGYNLTRYKIPAKDFFEGSLDYKMTTFLGGALVKYYDECGNEVGWSFVLGGKSLLGLSNSTGKVVGHQGALQ